MPIKANCSTGSPIVARFRELFLDHGELDGLEAMRRELQRRVPELTVCLPKIGETYSLPSGNAARRLTTGRPNAESAIGRDWRNAYAELVSGLKGDLGLIPEERRQEAIDQLREVLRSYNAFRDNHRAES
jgi:metallo-beta-lactamase family protein